ncbi:hypothetical protein FACS1894200_10980 [Spirochaetia bacterium]|nr:hypothetical protein FACS1894200_10980 [Spirochaetia bacterium]
MNRTNLPFLAGCDNGTSGGGAVFTDPYGIIMADIPAGTFMMGSPKDEVDRGSDETQHSVTLSAFTMAKHPVTQAQWQAVMRENPSEFTGDDKRPVETVSWYGAVAFCNALSELAGLSPAYTIDKTSKDPNNTNERDTVKWTVTLNAGATGYRLPTEAQWEYACRAGKTTPFNRGKRITKDKANYGRHYGETTRVGTFAPNAYGLYDMHGNVWEWCWDWKGDYSSASLIDPGGGASGSFRVARGGSWGSNARFLRSAFRGYDTPTSSNSSSSGFRLVRP